METTHAPSAPDGTVPAPIEDAEHYITTNPYWREAGAPPDHVAGAPAGLMAYVQRARRMVERALGITIVSRKNIEEKPFASYPSDPALRARRNVALSEILQRFLARMSFDVPAASLIPLIEEYERVFRAWTHKDLEGGFGFNNGLFLFTFVRTVDPEVIIESGCWRGFTTYLLHHASSATTRLHCFDINLRQLSFVSSKAQYIEDDISKHPLDIRGRRTIAFFDDHVSHLERLKLSDAYGIPFMVFDDDVTFLNVHSDGWPPLPSISMLLDETVRLTHFEWISNHRRLVADWTEADRDYVQRDRYARYTQDELFEVTGYQNSSRTTYLARR